jgi:TonB family protein
MSTKGGGTGGGGEGEGVIGGTSDVDTGGAGAENRKKGAKGPGGPSEKKVSVQTGTATVKGQLSKELIDQEVRRHKAQVKFCYNKQLTRFPDLQGKVTLSWIITMDGSVLKARVKTSSLGNADAESCMVRALEGWKFPKPTGGVVQVDYPFLFGAT